MFSELILCRKWGIVKSWRNKIGIFPGYMCIEVKGPQRPMWLKTRVNRRLFKALKCKQCGNKVDREMYKDNQRRL